MVYKIWRTLVRTAAAVCFVVGSTAQAGGVFYQSDFDPLGFAGSAKWYVDDNCKTGPDGTLPNGYYGVNLFAPGGCDVALAYLSVSLWQGGATTLDLAQGDPSLVTVEFPREMVDDSTPISNPVLVAGIWVVGGELAGVDTFLIGPKAITNITGTCNSTTADPTCDILGDYGVQFTSGHNWLAPLGSILGLRYPAIGNLPDPGAYLWEKNSDSRPCATPVTQFWWATFACAQEATVDDNGLGYAEFDTSTYGSGFKPLGRSINGDPTNVPEPGSLALLGGALVAGWFTRRRKARA
jgi:hypothetical protein